MLKVLQIRRTCAHVLKHAQLGLVAPLNVKPTCELAWTLPGLEASGYGWCGKRSWSRGSSSPGASLLKGSCNFHSRVLLKLVLRPLPRLNTLLPSRPVRPSTPQLPSRSAAAARRLALPFQTTSFTSVMCTGRGWWSVGLFVCMCELWSVKPVVLNKQESLGFLRILIIVVDMVSIFFTLNIHRWASLPFTTSKIIKVREKKQLILLTWLSVVVFLQWSDFL